MACSCRGGQKFTSGGAKILGYQVTFADGSKSDVYLTKPEARAEQRRRGGGTVYAVT